MNISLDNTQQEFSNPYKDEGMLIFLRKMRIRKEMFFFSHENWRPVAVI